MFTNRMRLYPCNSRVGDNVIRKLLFAGLFSLAATASADAAVIFDSSPNLATDHAAGNWVNFATNQNFVVKVDFANDVVVNGFDIFIDGFAEAGVGNPVEMKIFSEWPGDVPAPAPAKYFSTVHDIQPFDPKGPKMAHVDFTPIDLAAGEYWFGLSSTNNLNLTWASYRAPGTPLVSDDQIGLNGDKFWNHPDIYDLAFRIDGSFVSAVPEPATWALFILGFGFVGAAMRAGRDSKRALRAAC